MEDSLLLWNQYCNTPMATKSQPTCSMKIREALLKLFSYWPWARAEKLSLLSENKANEQNRPQLKSSLKQYHLLLLQIREVIPRDYSHIVLQLIEIVLWLDVIFWIIPAEKLIEDKHSQEYIITVPPLSWWKYVVRELKSHTSMYKEVPRRPTDRDVLPSATPANLLVAPPKKGFPMELVRIMMNPAPPDAFTCLQ